MIKLLIFPKEPGFSQNTYSEPLILFKNIINFTYINNLRLSIYYQ